MEMWWKKKNGVVFWFLTVLTWLSLTIQKLVVSETWFDHLCTQLISFQFCFGQDHLFISATDAPAFTSMLGHKGKASCFAVMWPPPPLTRPWHLHSSLYLVFLMVVYKREWRSTEESACVCLYMHALMMYMLVYGCTHCVYVCICMCSWCIC